MGASAFGIHQILFVRTLVTHHKLSLPSTIDVEVTGYMELHLFVDDGYVHRPNIYFYALADGISHALSN